MAQVGKVQPTPIPETYVSFNETPWVPKNLYGYFVVFSSFHGLILFFHFFIKFLCCINVL